MRYRTNILPSVLAAAVALAGACCAPAQALAPNDVPGVVRLTADQREAALEAGAVRAARELPVNGLSRGIHGEIGAEVGTGGSRALYGTAVVPLGDSGTAAFSFLTDRAGDRRGR